MADDRYEWENDASWEEPPYVNVDFSNEMSLAAANADYNTTLPSTPVAVVPKKNFWDVLTGLGNTASNIIAASNGNTQQAITSNASSTAANNTPLATTDKGKKTTMIILIVVGVAAVATLLYFSLKSSK